MKRRSALPALFLGFLCAACGTPDDASREPVLTDPAWREPAIAYSGYRAGQTPKGGPLPTQEQVEEDLRILERHWGLIRVYASDRHGEDVLEVIRREGIDLKVMLGIWLAREPGSEAENEAQVAEGIRLANAYEDIVVAVSVGNEVGIEWTEHPVPEESLLRYVRKVRPAVPQPITVADNYVWWRDEGDDVAREVDFITMHTYPIWERRDIDQGLSFTIENYEDVRRAHPGREIVIGEAGWATYTEGNLHVPRAGDETKQKRYFEEVSAWARENDIPLFYFEAFDEPWKGTGTEGYWGLFSVDRQAKLAMHGLFPEIAAPGPTSPSYPERIEVAGPDIRSVLKPEFASKVVDGSVNPLGPGLSNYGIVPAPGAGGDDALELDFNGEAWGGVYILLGSLDAGDADTLAMNLKVPPATVRLELKLEGPETNARSVDAMDYATEDGSGWLRVAIPLSALEGVDFARIAVLGIWNPRDAEGAFLAGALLLDDLRFE